MGLKFGRRQRLFSSLTFSFLLSLTLSLTTLLSITHHHFVYAQDNSSNNPDDSASKSSTSHARFLTTQVFDKYQKDANIASVENILANEEVTLKLTIKALQDFYKRRLHNFDATAGDTCCQVRTHKILITSADKSFKRQIPQILRQLRSNLKIIKRIRPEIYKIMHQPTNHKVKDQFRKLFTIANDKRPKGKEEVGDGDDKPVVKKTFTDLFLSHYKISYPELPPKAIVLILTHAVTKFHSEVAALKKKKDQLLELSFVNESIKESNVSNLIYEARKKLVALTSDHLGKLGEEVYQGSCQTGSLLTDDQIQDLDGYRQILATVGFKPPYRSRSTYASHAILLADLWKRKIPLLVRSTAICPEHGLHLYESFYVSGPQPFTYVPYQGDPQQMLSKDVAVIEGISDLSPNHHYNGKDLYTMSDEMDAILTNNHGFSHENHCPRLQQLKNEIEGQSFYDLFITTGSMHNQYVDKKKTIDFDLLKEDVREKLREKYTQHCNKAKNEGYCMENKAHFHLIHVYPSVAHVVYKKEKIGVDYNIMDEIDAELSRLKAKRPQQVQVEKQALEQAQQQKELEKDKDPKDKDKGKNHE